MRLILGSCFLLVMSLGITSCETKKNSSYTDTEPAAVEETNIIERPVMEVTTFNINSDVSPETFAKRDVTIENDFTSAQPGFIKRQSGLDDKGNYVVVVYWESVANADASMSKFMSDASVADYASMITGSTMKMARYNLDKPFEAAESRFVEIMTFDLNDGADNAEFDVLNQRVETEVTAKRVGFLQRLTGVNDANKQVVAIYWASKETSDAALQPFMEAPISQEFMKEMNQSSISMGRYNLLNKE